MRLLSAAFVVLLTLATSLAQAEDLTPAKQADIKRLIQVTGATSFGKQFGTAVAQQMFRALKTARPDVPDRAYAIMEKEVLGLLNEKIDAPGGLVEQIIPLYHKYYTHDDIKELLKFYQSPIGKKMVQVMPQFTNESMQVGAKWGQALGPELNTRVGNALKKEGLLPKENPPAAPAAGK